MPAMGRESKLWFARRCIEEKVDFLDAASGKRLHEHIHLVDHPEFIDEGSKAQIHSKGLAPPFSCP